MNNLINDIIFIKIDIIFVKHTREIKAIIDIKFNVNLNFIFARMIFMFETRYNVNISITQIFEHFQIIELEFFNSVNQHTKRLQFSNAFLNSFFIILFSRQLRVKNVKYFNFDYKQKKIQQNRDYKNTFL